MGDVNKLKDFAVDQLGVPPGMVDFLEDAAGWAKNGIAIYGFATAALDIADKLFGDKEPSVQQLIAGLDAKLDTLISTTNTILNGQLQAQFVEKASTISARRSALKSRQAMVEDFQQAPTPQRFTDLTSSLDTTLAEILNELLDADFNKLPITKSSYDAGADWFYGGGLWPWYRSSNEFFQVRVQVLQPTNFKPTGKLPPGYQPVQDKPFNASDKPRVL
jgi:hypothetical protein